MNPIDYKELFEMAKKEECEIQVTYTPESIEVLIRPWEPFEYKCPYQS